MAIRPSYILFVNLPCYFLASGADYNEASVLQPSLRVRPEIIEAVLAEKSLVLSEPDVVAHAYLLRQLHVTFLQSLVFRFCRLVEKYGYPFLCYFYLPCWLAS